jgi:hypothetical protein
MNRTIPVVLLTLAAAACGPRQTPTADPGTGPAADIVQPSDPAPAETTASGGERAGLLARIKVHMGMNTDQWPEEMSGLLEPGGVDALVGATRDELIAALGEPNAGPEFQGEDRLAWHVGVHAEPRMSFPPVLIVVFDAAGVATAANWQLAM